MSEIKRFEIQFNNPERVYFAGQEINIKVRFKIKTGRSHMDGKLVYFNKDG